MQTIQCNWGDMHRYGPLWFEHLKLRKRVFVDGAGWDVPHIGGAEWDQYDTPATEYFITFQKGSIVAASRALPCDFETVNGSYMIRDGCRGRIPGIPPGIWDAPPVCATTWEATRFAVCPDQPAAQKRAAMAENAWALIAGCADLGARQVIALMPPGFVGIFRRAGIAAERAGPVTRNADGEKFCVIRTPADSLSDQRLRATA